MSLSGKTELARALFRTPSPDSVTRISGTATADSDEGTVSVELEDGDVIEVGCIGSVSEGDTVTIHVQRGEAQVIASEGWGDRMQEAVDDAAAIAEATGQHFWHDSNGAHVTEVTADEWAQDQTGHNILVNSLGILLRKALNYVAAWTGSALSFYDGDGNSAGNITASFGSAGAQIGKAGESHIEMDYRSLKLVNGSGDAYFSASDLRDRSGVADITNRFIGDGSTREFWISPTASNTSYDVTVDGVAASPTKTVSVVTFGTAPAAGAVIDVNYQTEDPNATAFTFGRRGAGNVGAASFASGVGVVASGSYSHAEGNNTTASGPNSHAEGRDTTASGHRSHAEGYGTTASDYQSHAEGNNTTASGYYSHAEGNNTTASGNGSHAQNQGTVARATAQTALGKFNVEDSTSAVIIGNGTDDNARSNALTVDWNGNVEAAGTIEAKCGAVATSGVATASTGTTISAQEAVKWGGIAQVRLAFTRNSAITVLASGNITDFTAVTLASEYRPKVATAFACPADDAGPIFGTINTDGTVVVKYAESTGAQRTIASGTAFHVSATLVTG
ncbi:MAG: hypothetical protein J6V72_02455 [Kiritimatiellae bacterium]|nr:hypothetical protein [Kiritimatiellia bacterium]